MGLILKPIIGLIANAVVLYALTVALPDISYTGGATFFVLGGAILGLVNAIARPLVKVIALPFILITGGLFLIVINMGVLWFLQYFLSVAQFQDVTLAFPDLGTYVIGAIVFGIANWIIHLIK